MIKLLVNGSEVKFETTIFPDGTSQVWKVAEPLFEDDDIKILWMFESEAELFHVCQLAQLTQKLSRQEDSVLVAPYLPYARQDKGIDNGLSFALDTFTYILYHANICRIETFDRHSNTQTNSYIESETAEGFHKAIFNHDVVCFPDKGALARYEGSFPNVPMVYCEKVRNQQTGEITGLILNGSNLYDIDGKRVLIVDDICDGGMTFIKTAEVLKKWNASQIDLAVSHGLFSKGKQVLHDAGIKDIFTTNSLLRNAEGFKVC